MLENSFGVQLSYASIDRADGSDPRPAALRVLRDLRVFAALRDATAEWVDREEAVLAVAVTDDDRVLTLTTEDAIVTELTVPALRAALSDVGVKLWIDTEQVSTSDFDEFEAEFDDLAGSGPDDAETESGAAADESSSEAFDPELLQPVTVRVAAFSHRGPGVARLLAEANRTPVDHRESGAWSLQRFRTAEPTSGWVSSRADLPIIEVNRADDGSGWVEVTAASGTVPFWLDAERDTRPVLDVDTIAVAETAEVYRRLLTEGDGTRDELVEIAGGVRLDVDGAHRALISESLGGIVGTEARQRAFLAAFGIPVDLIAQAFEDEAKPGLLRFVPVGWPTAVWDTLVAGMGELAPLTRRGTIWQRVTGAIRRRPVLGVAIALGELAVGIWAARRWRGIGRGIGILAITDAIGDLAVWFARLRRR